MASRSLWRTALTSALVCCSVAACGLSGTKTSAAPPTIVCGQTMANAAAGSGVTDATQPGTVTVNGTSPAGLILRLSKDCSSGATVRITPPNAVRIATEAHAKGGGLTAITLEPKTKTADVVVSRPDGSSTTVLIRLVG